MAGTTIKGVGNSGNVQIPDMVTAAKQNAGTESNQADSNNSGSSGKTDAKSNNNTSDGKKNDKSDDQDSGGKNDKSDNKDSDQKSPDTIELPFIPAK